MTAVPDCACAVVVTVADASIPANSSAVVRLEVMESCSDPAPAQSLSAELLGLVNYLTPNETELAILTGTQPLALDRLQAGSLARRLLQRGARNVIVKMGAQGALLVSEERQHYWPAVPVHAVDTTAAGDAFNAAFAVALARGTTELEAGSYATAAAACSVTRPGAQPSMPTDEDAKVLLATTSTEEYLKAVL